MEKENPYVRIERETLEHLYKMLNWVKKQPKNEEVSWTKMRHEFGESLAGYQFPYCIYFNTVRQDFCPIGEGYRCLNCCNGLWAETAIADTWEDCLVKAQEMINHIEKYGIRTPDIFQIIDEVREPPYTVYIIKYHHVLFHIKLLTSWVWGHTIGDMIKALEDKSLEQFKGS